MPRTTRAFLHFLQHEASRAQQLYLLGDLFEYWAGDDDADDPLHREIASAITLLGQQGVAVFWIAGNRDFLLGQNFAASVGMTLLPDPHVVTIGSQRIVLTHGDAYCTDDLAYMAFRTQVRGAEWQKTFLEQPLSVRKEMIAALREQSRAAQRDKTMAIMDVNHAAIADLFRQSGTTVMIHGHTHRPGRHEYMEDDMARTRYVLPDWDCDQQPQRGGWIGVSAAGEVHAFALSDLPDLPDLARK